MRLVLVLACLAASVACSWQGTALAAAPPEAPEAAIELTLAEDGRLRAAGLLPEGLSPETLATLLPDADAAGVETGGATAEADWQEAIEALAIVLPRFRTAQARLGEGGLALGGELKPGFSAIGTDATLRAALGRRWSIELDIVESEPLAVLVFDKTVEGVTLKGLMPAGLEPPAAVALFGGSARDRGLAGGGDGDAESWARTIAALADTLDLFVVASGVIVEGEVAIEGLLRAGYPRDAVAGRLSERIAEGWRGRLDAAETTPSEGDRRVSLETGQPENFRRGYWLPDVGFPVSPERCRDETKAALAGRGLPFLEGSATLDESGQAMLDRLAAIAVRCLNSSSMRLAIAAHTDSVGNDRANQALSEARAVAVRRALLDRGVRADAVIASGHGESRPIATNDTAEGRALNRRIEFEWSDG